MLPYQNYSMNNYAPFQQQGFQNGYQQMQQNVNPYLDRMNQVQPMQQPVPGLAGKIVEDFGTITANDVPMDGNGAIFVKRDGSEIQIRNWSANGTIATSRFKPVLEDQAGKLSNELVNAPVRLSDDVVAMLQENFSGINERLDKLERAIKPSTKRKEPGSDE